MNNHFSKFFFVSLLVLVGLFLIYPTVNAAGLVPCGRSTGTPEEMKPCTTCDIFALASRIINFVLFTVVPAVAVLFYLIGGLMILLGGAYPGLVSTGKNFFWNTTIGLFIIFGAWMITNTVLKSLVGDNDISKNWYKIECTSVVIKPPATVRYNCNSENACVVNASGPYTEPTCDSKCTPAQTYYMCTTDNPSQCVVDPQGSATDPDDYTTSNCDGECQPLPVPVTISSSLSDAIINQSYAQPVNASGGISPYGYSVSAGSLPPGLTLSTNGIITGTPTTANTYTFTVKVEDSTVPTKQSVTKEMSIKVVTASAAVIISNVAKSNITSNGATITWTTDKPSTSQVEYGTSSSFGKSTTVDNTPKINHSITLAGLTADTTHYYRAKSSVTDFTAVSSTNTFKTSGTSPTPTLTPTPTVSKTPTPAPSTSISVIPTPSGGGMACLFTGTNLCQGQPLKLSGGKLVPDSKPVCGVSACSQFLPAINAAAAKTGISANLLKATMYKESGCQVNPPYYGSGNSYGLMQMQPGTANTFKNFCGVTENITSSWLTNPANATAHICIAAYFYKSLADGSCGYSPRNVLAGYSAGPGRCQASVDCTGEKSCDGNTVRQWECLYDNPQHTVCNGDNTVIGAASKLNETKFSVVNKLYCVDHPGF